jgi:hypothetical protein
LDLYSNLPSPSVHLGGQSEITDFETLPPRSEISNMTWGSLSPLNRMSRFASGRTSRSTPGPRSTFLFNTPVGHFSRTLRDRARFLWELFKLNYRMLISLTVTLFVAIFVRGYLKAANSDLSQPTPIPASDLQSTQPKRSLRAMDAMYANGEQCRGVFPTGK